MNNAFWEAKRVYGYYLCLADSLHSFFPSHLLFTKGNVSRDPTQSTTGSPSSEGHTLSEIRPQNALVTAMLAPSRHEMVRVCPVQIVMPDSKVFLKIKT